MSTDTQLDSCFNAIETECRQQGIAVRRLESAYGGSVRVQLKGVSCDWDLYVQADETFLKLPAIWLSNPHQLLAHVSYDGGVCVTDNQGLSIDSDRRAEIAAYAVKLAYALLERSAADTASSMTEFYDELEGYWLSLPRSLRARSAFEVDGRDRFVSAYVDDRARPPKWYAGEKVESLPSEFRAKNVTAVRALYVHLGTIPPPPVRPGLLGAEFVEAVRLSLSPAQLALWSEFIGTSRNKTKRLVLFVSMPRASGGFSLVGVMFHAHREAVDAARDVIPFTVRRHTSTYMRERGGASIELMGKHVAILGCGAVGSFVADTLASSGVGRLTLVDNDEYSEDNVFRHVLSPNYIGSSKVLGLKVCLENRYPGLQVTHVPTIAQTWVSSASVTDVDAVVVAFGAPSLERHFSRLFRKMSKTLLVVFTWLEPLDLGGHSVLIHCGREGCLDCLYRDEEGLPTLSPRSAFLEPNQPVSRNLTGCASTFVPFGAIQARRTGMLAAEHLLDEFAGDGNASYRFWVGEGRIAAREGLRTTKWWINARNLPAINDGAARVFGRACARCRGDK